MVTKKIAKSKKEIIAKVLKLRQKNREWYDQLNANDQELMKNILLLKKESIAWFEKLNENDQKIILNQVTLLRHQNQTHNLLNNLLEDTETLQNEMIQTQI